MATFLNYKERKALNEFLGKALQQNHANLYALCNTRFPTTVEDLTPGTRNPAKIIALNERLNAQAERVEDLLLSIEYPDQCECPDNSHQFASDDKELSAEEQTALIKADLAEAFDS